MYHIAAVTFTGVVACFVVVASGPAQPEMAIDELVRRLGSDSFEAREAATRMLLGRDDAEQHLKKAAQGSDPEIARRAKAILEQVTKRRRHRLLGVVGKFAKGFEVDKLVDALTADLGESGEWESWDPVFDIAEGLLEFERKQFGLARPKGQPSLGPIRFGRSEGQKAFKKGRALSANRLANQLPPHSWQFLVRAGEIDSSQSLGESALLCASNVRSGMFQRVICLANGPLKTPILGEALVICDDDVELRSVYRTIVIARGKVKATTVHDSTILCSDFIEIGREAVQSTLITGKTIHVAKREQLRKCNVKENVPNATAPVKFFELSQIDLEIRDGDKGVEVVKVRPGTRLHSASVRAGDVILAIQSTPVKSVDACRRQLRKVVAINEAFKLRVRRSAGDIELRIPLGDH